MLANQGDYQLSELDDDTLARRADTESDAFAELYRRHLDGVYRYILSRVNNVQDAQDLTTQTFMGALNGIDNYTPQGSFMAWLIGIAKRKIIDHFRKKKDNVALEFAERLAGDSPPIEQTISNQLQLEAVLDSMDTITADRAEAIRLRLFCGLSAREAGDKMGKSADAVNMLVYRGLQDLRKKLRPQKPEQDEVRS